MDTSQENYKKVIQNFRSSINNIISEHPLSAQSLPDYRNLKYLVYKQCVECNLPLTHPLYQQTVDHIKHQLQDTNIQRQIMGIRLARALPTAHRFKVLQACENQLLQMVASKSSGDFNYQVVSDMTQLALSIYNLTRFSEDIYFNQNQKVIQLFSRMIQKVYDNDKNVMRNSYQILRSLFLNFGYKTQDQDGNKLIDKIISILLHSSTFATMQQSSKVPQSTTILQKLRLLILRCRQFQARIRSRLFVGIAYMLTYIQYFPSEIIDLLIKENFIIIQNVNESDIHLQCLNTFKGIINIPMINFHTKNILIKRLYPILFDISYKKQYLQYYILILYASSKLPVKVKYQISTSLLQTTKNIPSQFSRFIFYHQTCKNLMEIACGSQTKSSLNELNVLVTIFNYPWLIHRINQENDLFKSEFLIFLIHECFGLKQKPGRQQITDLLSLCHRFIDWKCSAKEQSNIPTIKFAFDMYLAFLQEAESRIGDFMITFLQQLIERCNSDSIYFVFKLKLISVLIKLPYYCSNWQKLQGRLKLDFLQGIKHNIMPPKPKQIFDYEYSLTQDGQIQSRKQIQYIKIVRNLLNNLPTVHDVEDKVTRITFQYNTYLNDLAMSQSSNKQLINCLLVLQGDNFFSQCQRNFLLSLISEKDCLGNNYEYNLSQQILYSPYQQFNYNEDINILGQMSPIQLTLRILPSPSYSTVKLQIKKSQWVGMPEDMRLVISSGIQKKQIPFQSCITEIRIDRTSYLYFQIWATVGTDILIGCGQIKLKRKQQWLKLNHLRFIDGIKTKVALHNSEIMDGTYISFYFGQPILIQIIKKTNEVVLGLTNREIWVEMQDTIAELLQDLRDGNAQIMNY